MIVPTTTLRYPSGKFLFMMDDLETPLNLTEIINHPLLEGMYTSPLYLVIYMTLMDSIESVPTNILYPIIEFSSSTAVFQ